MPGWNLPPGCTDADVDRAMGGDEPRCYVCGEYRDIEDLEPVWMNGHEKPVCGRCQSELDGESDGE